MNLKRRLFVTEYAVDLNATKAATRAGYSKKTARQQGARLLSQASIRQEIETCLKARMERLDFDADKVLQELAKMAFFDIRKCFWPNGTLKSPHEMDGNTAASIAGYEVTELFLSNKIIAEIKAAARDEGAYQLAYALGALNIHQWLDVQAFYQNHYKQILSRPSSN